MANDAHADTTAGVTARNPNAESGSLGQLHYACVRAVIDAAGAWLGAAVLVVIAILAGALLYTGNAAAAAPNHQQSLIASIAVPSTVQSLGCCNDASFGSITTTVPRLGKVDVSVDYAACGVVACRPDGENQLQVILTTRSGDTLTIVGTGTGGLGKGSGSWKITDGSGRLAKWTGSGEWTVGVTYLSFATGEGQAARLNLSLQGLLG